MPAVLKALLEQQQGAGDADGDGVIDEWLADAVEWDGYVKRDKEAAGLLMHLLKTGGWCSGQRGWLASHDVQQTCF